MHSQIENYLLWQEDRGFLHPTPLREVSRPLFHSQEQRERVAVVCTAQGAEHDLLVRMLAAIGLEPGVVTTDHNCAAGLRLVMAPPPRGCRLGEALESENGIDYYTYHPLVLIKVPEIKSIAWNQLQEFAELLRLSAGST